jgi:hypothetical protein
MKRALVLALLGLGLSAAPAWAEHTKIQLNVTSPRGEQTAFVD